MLYENTYKVVKKDPTSKVERSINKFAVRAQKSDNIVIICIL